MAGLRVEVTGGVARLTLDRPDVHNAFDEALIAELTGALKAVARDTAVRAVALGAAGASFCAGADLGWMRRAAGWSAEENFNDAKALADLLLVLDRLGKPTVALAHGAVYGGGVGLVAACDIALAAEDARFCLSEVRLGLVPATIAPYVARAIGARAMRRFALTAEVIDAPAALRLGLAHEVVPRAELAARGEAVLKLVLNNGPDAISMTKNIIADVAGRPITPALRGRTARAIAAARTGAEGREGVAAFLEKRRPSWRGPG